MEAVCPSTIHTQCKVQGSWMVVTMTVELVSQLVVRWVGLDVTNSLLLSLVQTVITDTTCVPHSYHILFQILSLLTLLLLNFIVSDTVITVIVSDITLLPWCPPTRPNSMLSPLTREEVPQQLSSLVLALQVSISQDLLDVSSLSKVVFLLLIFKC